MALPNGLAQVSDLGALQGSLGYNIVDIPLMTATATPGSPAAGLFYSSITNRAPMYDLRKDLSANMGINRIQTQQVYRLQDEVGLNNEPVWGVTNDAYGQIRCVGNWINVAGQSGPFMAPTLTTDYTEVTFYGTGLNVLYPSYNTVRTATVSIDGTGATVVSLSTASSSAAFAGRNYSMNSVANLVSGLSLGVHTVKILQTGTFEFYGVEILNEQFLTTTANINSNNQLTSVANTTGLAVGMDITGVNIPVNTTISSISGSTITMSTSATATTIGITVKFGNNFIKVNPGTSWNSGQKLYNPAQHLSAYNSGFESGTLGTRGGRVVVYQKSDGTIAKAVRPTDASSLTLTSANHANEEVARTYSWREFGAGRFSGADDFSLAGAVAGIRSFTLDDGVTTLTSNSAFSLMTGAADALLHGVNTTFHTFTFVGTGLDILQQDSASGGADTYTIQIDGGTAIALPTAGNTALRRTKIVSGLPYGTHTVRWNRVAATTWSIGIMQFIVYQPKKPTLPSGAIELADYNVMADFVSASVEGVDSVSTGTLRKLLLRELTFVGTWSISTAAVGVGNTPGGFQVFTTTLNSYFEYTFFGTGFTYRMNSEANQTQTVTVDGATNFTTANSTPSFGAGWSTNPTISFLHAGATWTASAGTITGNGGTGGILSISGLNLGLHRVRIQLTATAGGGLYPDALDIITPIHSHKDNGPFTLQNTLTVGSQGIRDGRLLASQVNKKVSAQATGVNNAPTTTSTQMVPVPDMSVTINLKKTTDVHIFWTAVVQCTGNDNPFRAYINGVAFDPTYANHQLVNLRNTLTGQGIATLPAGVHKIDVYWVVSGAQTATLNSTGRALTVKEL